MTSPGLAQWGEALAYLKQGGVVAYPTETCYGLAVNAGNERAVNRLRRLKGRDGQRPISILIASPDWLDDLVLPPSAQEWALIRAFWPGPLTLLLKPVENGPCSSLAMPRLGLRCSSHPVAQGLVEAFGEPLTSTSANRSGESSLVDPLAVERVFKDEDVLVLPDPAPSAVASGSTVAAIEDGRLKIYREGALPADRLEDVLAGLRSRGR